MDWYTTCLLSWFYGISPSKVKAEKWTQEEIDKAQAYCGEKMADPIEYVNRVW